MKKGYNLFQVSIIIVVTAVISAITTGTIYSKSFASGDGVNYSLYAMDENIRNFLNVYSELTDDYYEDVNKKGMIDSAINGMLNYIDESYTTYLDENSASSLIEQLSGTYEGIGITVQNHEIISIMADSPADKAGLLEGDVIVSINSEDVREKSVNELVQLIKNNENYVLIGIERMDEYLEFQINITTLYVPSVQYNMIDDTNIGYIKMSVFSSHLTEETIAALNKLDQFGMEKLIIDLRNNTGGYLEQAYQTAQLFLKKGRLVYTLKDKDSSEKFYDLDNNNQDYPIVVLVNNATASASEILAGALKDSYGATLVGTVTFGKGKVQHTYSLSNGGIVKYTSSRWLRPNGTCVDNIGITPDYIIENDYLYDNPDSENKILLEIVDNQKNKAIEILNT